MIKTSRQVVIFICRQWTNILIRLKLLIGCTNRTDWQTYWHIALDSELPFHTLLFHGFLHSKISKSSETGTGMCLPLFWPKIYQNVLFICIGSHWKCFLSISRTFIKWQKKCWKTACSETHATALYLGIFAKHEGKRVCRDE